MQYIANYMVSILLTKMAILTQMDILIKPQNFTAPII